MSGSGHKRETPEGHGAPWPNLIEGIQTSDPGMLIEKTLSSPDYRCFVILKLLAYLLLA